MSAVERVHISGFWYVQIHPKGGGDRWTLTHQTVSTSRISTPPHQIQRYQATIFFKPVCFCSRKEWQRCQILPKLEVYFRFPLVRRLGLFKQQNPQGITLRGSTTNWPPTTTSQYTFFQREVSHVSCLVRMRILWKLPFFLLGCVSCVGSQQCN